MNKFLILALLPLAALAQAPAASEPEEMPIEMPGEMPATDFPAAPLPKADAPSEEPLVAPPSGSSASSKAPELGTVLSPDRDEETPFGLFFAPWRESAAEQDIDRPARLLQEELLPIDEDVFIRSIEYYEALSGALKSRNQVTPAAAAPSAAPIQP